ncbi:MAG: Na(+)/H(+) antiporter subunit B [Clostridia bacterium]
MELINIILLVLLIISGVAAMVFRNIIHSILALSVFSVALAVIFAIHRAPDVAIAEASVGAGLTTGLFIIAISNTIGAKPYE